jgi:hypothetical protein
MGASSWLYLCMIIINKFVCLGTISYIARKTKWFVPPPPPPFFIIFIRNFFNVKISDQNLIYLHMKINFTFKIGIRCTSSVAVWLDLFFANMFEFFGRLLTFCGHFSWYLKIVILCIPRNLQGNAAVASFHIAFRSLYV